MQIRPPYWYTKMADVYKVLSITWLLKASGFKIFHLAFSTTSYFCMVLLAELEKQTAYVDNESMSLNSLQLSLTFRVCYRLYFDLGVRFFHFSCQEARKNRHLPQVVPLFSSFQGTAHAKRYSEVSHAREYQALFLSTLHHDD